MKSLPEEAAWADRQDGSGNVWKLSRGISAGRRGARLTQGCLLHRCKAKPDESVTTMGGLP